MLEQCTIQRMLRVAGLHQHFTLGHLTSPTRPARDLHELRKQTLAGPIIVREQCGIRIDHAHQRKPLKIMALCDHLRA